MYTVHSLPPSLSPSLPLSLPPSLLPSLPQVVAPKKERLAEAEKSFSETMTDLNAKRAELKEVCATAH